MDAVSGFWFAAIPIALVILAVLLFKQLFAKTHKSYWMYTALLVIAGFVIFVIVNTSGIIPEAELREMASRPPPSLGEFTSRMPVLQIVLLVLAGGVWIIGANFLTVWQRRKTGRSWWVSLNPFGPVFRDFDRKAWAIFGLLLLSSMVLAMLALSIPPEGKDVPRVQSSPDAMNTNSPTTSAAQ